MHNAGCHATAHAPKGPKGDTRRIKLTPTKHRGARLRTRIKAKCKVRILLYSICICIYVYDLNNYLWSELRHHVACKYNVAYTFFIPESTRVLVGAKPQAHVLWLGGRGTQGAGVRYQNTSQIQILLAINFDKKGEERC